jgi:hypothetical protein
MVIGRSYFWISTMSAPPCAALVVDSTKQAIT